MERITQKQICKSSVKREINIIYFKTDRSKAFKLQSSTSDFCIFASALTLDFQPQLNQIPQTKGCSLSLGTFVLLSFRKFVELFNVTT